MRRILSLILAAVIAAPAVAQDAQREFIPVTGDVYLMRNNFHLSLIVKTADGTVRVDPINAEAGEWVNANLSEIGAGPVTHLIYSHSHGDHGSGGGAHEGAEVIMHEDAPETIDGVAATMRVGDSHVMEVGGKTLELTNLGPGHDNHMLAVVVRPENVGFIVDVAAPKRLPFRNFGGANIDDWMDQVRTAMALDFEIFAPGHGMIGVHADLADHLEYIETLRAEVMAGLNAGKSVDELKAELTFDAYSNWLAYADFREPNIEGMAEFLQNSGQVN